MRLLLIAHGSRDPRYAASFETLCLRLRAAGHAARVGHLGLCSPSVVEAAELLARDAPAPFAEPIAAVPMFLNHGYHVAHDVPAAVATARTVLATRARIAVSLTPSRSAINTFGMSSSNSSAARSRRFSVRPFPGTRGQCSTHTTGLPPLLTTPSIFNRH